jgi:2-phosphosulfolactate phosphatase
MEAAEPPPRRSVDVAFVPSELEATEVAVVVDVLRASSTIVAALAAGYARVLCVGSVEAARGLRAPNRVLAGEQDTRPVADFDLGNSPAEVGEGEGRELVLSTTNGTPAILRAVERADQVLIGSLLNLDALAAAIPDDADVAVVCAGTGRRFSLDDAYTAGRIVAVLGGRRTDAALAAQQLAGAYEEAATALGECAHADVLREVGQAEDIETCARESAFDVVPRVIETSSGTAIVSGLEQTRVTQGEKPAEDILTST